MGRGEWKSMTRRIAMPRRKSSSISRLSESDDGKVAGISEV